jgi:hypothetical protein
MARKVIGTREYATINLKCRVCGKEFPITGYVSFDLEGKPKRTEFICDDCKNK